MTLRTCLAIVPLHTQLIYMHAPTNLRSFLTRICRQEVNSTQRLSSGMAYLELPGTQEFTLHPYHDDCIIRGKYFYDVEDIMEYLSSLGIVKDSRILNLSTSGDKFLIPEYLEYTALTRTLARRLSFMLRAIGTLDPFIKSQKGKLIHVTSGNVIPLGVTIPLYRTVDIPSFDNDYDLRTGVYEIL